MISHWVQSVVDFARAHTLLAYGLAFLLTGAEAFPIVGALVPGTAVIIALGALVPAGALRFWPLVAFATTGAIAGDGFSYWLGHRYKLEAANHWPLRGHPSLIERGEAFFRRYGGKAILVARFTPGVRAVVPLVAGITGMPAVRFYTLNIISAVLWAPAHVVMGVLRAMAEIG
jgi:membrane protein DedA with SNARE-associated domain